MTTIKYAQVGSICSDITTVENLLIRFADELEQLVKAQPKRALQGQRRWFKKLIREARTVDHDTQEADDVLADLFGALEEFAPPYCTFGAHEGDGADYGFWPCQDTFQE